MKRKITYRYKPSAVSYKVIADGIYKIIKQGKEQTDAGNQTNQDANLQF